MNYYIKLKQLLETKSNETITQKDYGRAAQIYVSYDAIEAVFFQINHLMLNDVMYKPISQTINFPLIWCGLANGYWPTVAKIIDDTLDDSITKVLWIQR